MGLTTWKGVKLDICPSIKTFMHWLVFISMARVRTIVIQDKNIVQFDGSNN